MRPSLLDPLFAPLASLPGVGPKLARLFDRLLRRSDAGTPARVVDLALHLPVGGIDRTARPAIALAPEGAVATIRLRVDRHVPAPPGRSAAPYRVMGHDETGELTLVFFRGRANYLEKQLPVGEVRYVSGTVEWYNGRPQMVHPDHVVAEADLATLPPVEPTYLQTEGLTRKVLRKSIGAALERVPSLPEWIEPSVIVRHGWARFDDALRSVHDPRSVEEIAPEAGDRARLAYDELFSGQVALGLVRATMKRAKGKARSFDGRLAAKMREALPFSLTKGQEEAIAEIQTDLRSPERMLRLLQGDVGSGKTVVALLAACGVVEDGAQASIMAPTEVLARQHFATMEPLCRAAGVRIELLTGREKGVGRARTLEGVRSGEVHILVGTHALFQTGVEFQDLGLAVVDEQHRFGVQQRLTLASKGEATDILVMTATPIPRTLVMTHFGDMDVSRLTEKPAGRRRIATSIVSTERLPELVGRIGAALDRGDKAYWICPLVEENEDLELTAAEVRFEALRDRFGRAVGLVHGRMNSADKDRAMRAFKEGDTRLLVATTVVEVGVDVPDASIIVIEHAERFGLSQLHQLRGRVGRGSKASTCILLYRAPLGETAKARLQVMRDTDDGFVIAEEDLRLRGEGELLGTRQAGTPGFRIARPDIHGDLMETARDDAKLLLARDPDLTSERGEAVRLCLYLFGQDDAVRLLRAG